MSIKNQKGFAIWFTGLSGAGKTTIAEHLQQRLNSQGYATKLLDGDILGNGINAGLGFTEEDRIENIRRAAEVAKLFVESEFITICSFITPTHKARNLVKTIISESNVIEVFIDCSLELCEKRDVKGLYKKVRAGNVANFTGISSTFEKPLYSNLIINTEESEISTCVNQIYNYLNVTVLQEAVHS